jgi:hypothetical protein
VNHFTYQIQQACAVPCPRCTGALSLGDPNIHVTRLVELPGAYEHAAQPLLLMQGLVIGQIYRAIQGTALLDNLNAFLFFA